MAVDVIVTGLGPLRKEAEEAAAKIRSRMQKALDEAVGKMLNLDPAPADPTGAAPDPPLEQPADTAAQPPDLEQVSYVEPGVWVGEEPLEGVSFRFDPGPDATDGCYLTSESRTWGLRPFAGGAAVNEIGVLQALEEMDAAARMRVLTYAVDRWWLVDEKGAGA